MTGQVESAQERILRVAEEKRAERERGFNSGAIWAVFGVIMALIFWGVWHIIIDLLKETFEEPPVFLGLGSLIGLAVVWAFMMRGTRRSMLDLWNLSDK